MKLVDAQFLNHVAYGNYECVSLAGGDYGFYNAVEVGLLVVVGWRFVQKLLDDISIFLRQCLADFRTSVLRRNRLADFYELVERHTIEIIERVLLALYQFEFTFGIIYERTKLPDFRFAHGITESLRHLAAYVSGRIAKNVTEGFVFTMQIGHEMLSTLRQTHDSLEIHYFGTGSRYIRKILSQKLEYTSVGFYAFYFTFCCGHRS